MLGLLRSILALVLFLIDYTIGIILTIIKGDKWKPRDLRSAKKVTGVQVPNPKKKPNETNPYRNVSVAGGRLQETPFDGIYTIHEVVREAMKRFSTRKCMGVRRLVDIENTTVKKADGTDGKWQTFVYEKDLTWETYAQIDQRIQHIASGIVQFTGLNSEGRLGVFANTSQEWMLCAQAAMRYNITLVTVYASLGEEALVHCLNEANVTALLADESLLVKLQKLASQVPSLSHVIYIPEKRDDDEATAKKYSHGTSLKIKSIRDVEQLGKSSSKDPAVKKVATGDSVALIMYTSGTTGIPKGVIIPHKSVVAAIAGVDAALECDWSIEQTYLAYLPLAHILEFVAEHFMLVHGCLIGYGNAKTLSDRAAKPCGDMSAVKPTLFAGVPRVFDTIKKGILELIDSPKTHPIARWMFKTAFEQKRAALRAGRETPLWNLLVFNKVRKQMGGRISLIASGGAALGAETQEFLRVILSASICQGTGLTESCAALSVQPAWYPFKTKCCGTLVPTVEVKLVSVEDMGYRADDPSGPKGEIVVRGTSMSTGYYKQPKQTAEAYKEDGWFYTGDVGTFDEYGQISIIDRKKNLVKLDHGEYVALEKLEVVYGNSSYVSPNGICCYADSSVSFVSALILPQPTQIKKFADEHGIKGTMVELYKNEKVVAEVMHSLKAEAKRGNLQGAELVGKITLLDAEWTPENDCLTAAMKLKRNIIAKRHEAEINKMYGRK